MNLASRIYRRLARSFPHEFQLAYGADLMQLGEDVVEEIAKRQGLLGLIRFLLDIAIRIPIEYLSEMRTDLKHGWRALRKSPGFALVGILSLGIGMGLSTVIYSSELQEIIRPLPAVAHASDLVMPENPVSYFYIEQFRQEKRLFTGVAAFQVHIPFSVTLPGERGAKPERVFGQLVSPDYFSTLGVQPQQGRLLDPALDRSGDAPAVVVSDRFWRNRLNSSPNAVGQTLRLNGQLATIVGIGPRNFNGVLADTPSELFVPITVPAALAPELAGDVLHQRNAKEFLAMMCLAPGVSLESAEAALDAVTRRLDEQDPSLPARTDKGRRITLLAAGTRVPIPKAFRPIALGFFGVLISLIMTIACMNLANMLLARAGDRQKEWAIRLASGASRFRLIRQMMAEGVLLSTIGGVAGFAIGYVISVLNSRLTLPSAVPQEPDITPDWRIAVLLFALAIVCGIGFSIAPALRATRTDLTPALKEGASLRLPGYGRFGLRNLMMVAQVAGSLMLLLITGFLVLGIYQASIVQTKFDPRAMALLSVDPIRDGYSPEKAQSFFEKLPARLKSANPASNIVLAAQTPFSLGDATIQVTVEDSRTNSRAQHSVVKETVGAGYFAALNEPVISGREFAEFDQQVESGGSNAVPVVLNEKAARTFFGKATALGAHVRDGRQSYEVVGIVPDLKNGLGITRSTLYLPLTRRDFASPPAGGITIIARSDAGTAPLDAIRREIALIDPRLSVFYVHTLGEYLDQSRAVERRAVSTYGGIGVFGLILSAIGLAGITAYAVSQRRKEIGIRTALGATKSQILRLVLREGTALIIIGTVLGFAGATGLAKLLSALTNILVDALRIGSTDPRLLIGAPVLLAALALLACYIPARRAAKIDPLRALREE
jgi:predicted permease